MVHRGGYSGQVRHDSVRHLYARLEGGYSEEETRKLCDVLQIPLRFGERSGGTGEAKENLNGEEKSQKRPKLM